MRLMTADGTIHRCSRTENAELFAHAGLGVDLPLRDAVVDAIARDDLDAEIGDDRDRHGDLLQDARSWG